MLTTSRVEAFSDGVFAIAMTLLILEVHDPGKPRGALLHGLLHQWPSYASYAESLLIIGIIWVNHHALFGHVTRGDRPLLCINLLLLMVVAFIPFPTVLLARYLRVGGSDAQSAAVLYSATMTVMGLIVSALWAWLLHQRELLCPDLHQLSLVVDRQAGSGQVTETGAGPFTCHSMSSVNVAFTVSTSPGRTPHGAR